MKKNEAEDKRSSHQNQAQLVYTEKKKDVQAARTDPAVRTISFDLQKCLATPHLRNGVAFYKRQLYTYNLLFTRRFENILKRESGREDNQSIFRSLWRAKFKFRCVYDAKLPN